VTLVVSTDDYISTVVIRQERGGREKRKKERGSLPIPGEIFGVEEGRIGVERCKETE